MRKVIAMMLMLLPMLAGAQGVVNFVLTPNGTYQTEDGQDFIVVPFEGKTAHQIYQELATNVGSTFNNPSKVMSGVEDASIKIRAYSDEIVYYKPFGYIYTFPFGGYYQLEFKIKDGRVRVSAPFVESTLEYRNTDGKLLTVSFKEAVGKLYKNGSLQEKKAKYYYSSMNKMNNVVNSILCASKNQEETEDW